MTMTADIVERLRALRPADGVGRVINVAQTAALEIILLRDRVERAETALRDMGAPAPDPGPTQDQRDALREELIEAMARDLCRSDDRDPDSGASACMGRWRAEARLALAAIEACGCVVVPRAPTEDQRDAMRDMAAEARRLNLE